MPTPTPIPTLLLLTALPLTLLSQVQAWQPLPPLPKPDFFANRPTFSGSGHQHQHERRQSGTGTGTGPCAVLAGSGNVSYPPTAVRDCLLTVPFRDDVRQNNLDYIRGHMSLDIFEYDHYLNTNPTLAQNVNVRAGLDEIAGRSYASDWEFQRDVSDLIFSLNDGHYGWSTCYDFFVTRHGVPIVALADSTSSSTTSSNIYIAPDLARLAQIFTAVDPAFYSGIDVDQIAGARVTQIDGKDPWEYVREQADLAGVYQDKEQRINYMFSSHKLTYGAWDHSPGAFTLQRGFQSDSLAMTVMTNSTQQQTLNLQVPWRSLWTSRYSFSFSTGQQFFDSRCDAGEELPPSTAPTNGTTGTLGQAVPLAASAADLKAMKAEIPPTQPRIDLDSPYTASGPLVKQFISANNTALQRSVYTYCAPDADYTEWPLASAVNPLRRSEYLGGRDIQFYQLQASRTGGVSTGVIFLGTLEPEPMLQDCLDRFILDIVLGLQNFTEAGVERVIIDTSNNPGGYVYFSGLLQLALAGGQYEPELNFEVLYRKSPMSEDAVAAHVANTRLPITYWDPIRNLDSDGQQLSASDNWMNPGTDVTIGNSTLRASNRVQFAPENSISDVTGINRIAPYASNEIVFTGNGLCGSACAGFTNFLAEYKNTSAYINSGQPNEDITYTAFGSGNAVSSLAVDEQLPELGLDITNYRPNLLTTATFAYSLSAGLSPNISPGEFLQYRTLFANSVYSLTAEEYVDPIVRWERVANQGFHSNVTTGSGGGSGGTGNTGGGSGSNGTGAALSSYTISVLPACALVVSVAASLLFV